MHESPCMRERESPARLAVLGVPTLDRKLHGVLPPFANSIVQVLMNSTRTPGFRCDFRSSINTFHSYTSTSDHKAILFKFGSAYTRSELVGNNSTRTSSIPWRFTYMSPYDPGAYPLAQSVNVLAHASVIISLSGA